MSSSEIRGRMRKSFLAGMLVLACGGKPQVEAPVAVPEPPAVPGFDGAMRLESAVVPRSYALDLTLDPAKDSFSGVVTVQLDVQKPTELLRLHAEDMTFEDVAVSPAGKNAWAKATPHVAVNGGVSLLLSQPLEVGPAELRLRYRAPLPEAPNGIYRVEDQGRWYIFSQFEPIEARRAFPCFDQPSFKTPFRITLRVPDGQEALSNTRETASSLEGPLRVVQFEETAPLPTYLVAFAVGPFDIREAPAGTPAQLRIVATQGKGVFADQALAWTPPILKNLTDYFGEPYPFQKLDQLAVPNFAAGAMENVGLVTYRESLLLVDAKASVLDRFASQSVIAHELAHMWFGNKVTMPWWDELWLNESFATWMAPKVLAGVSPELEPLLSRVTDTQRAMTLDSRRDARAIRQPVREQGDIYNAFDGITYAKGAALLTMLEGWVGAEPFQTGVRAYMQAHAFGSGTTSDLLESIEQATGKPVARVAQSFLSQPGTPNILFRTECKKSGAGQTNTLTLTQTRYLPKGSDAPQGEPWILPVCMRHASAKPAALKRECLLLEAREQTFPIAGACPTRLIPNDSAEGYYRWELPTKSLQALLAAKPSELGLAELLALPGDLGALAEAESLPAGEYLTALTRVGASSHPRVLGAVIGELEKVYETAVDDALRPGFAAWVRGLLAPQLKRIGTQASSKETPSAGLVRPDLLLALAVWGQDTQLLELASGKVEQYLSEPTSLSSEELAVWLPIEAESGNPELWEKLRVRTAAVQNPSERRLLVSALGRFSDQKLVLRSLDLLLDGQLRGQDYRSLVGPMRAPARLTALDWLQTHYAALLERIGPKAAPRLPDIGHGLCSADAHARLERFFRSLENPPSGLGRNLNLVLEEVERCMKRRSYLTPALIARFEAKR
jgi:aminopeptidase N